MKEKMNNSEVNKKSNHQNRCIHKCKAFGIAVGALCMITVVIIAICSMNTSWEKVDGDIAEVVVSEEVASEEVTIEDVLDVDNSEKGDIGEEYNEIPVKYCNTSRWGGDLYNPNNVCDRDLSTRYIAGSNEDGIGEMLEINFGDEKGIDSYVIKKIELFLGKQKTGETSPCSNKSKMPSRLEFHFADGTIIEADVNYNEETSESIIIDLNIIGHEVISHNCIVKLVDSINGKRYEDCCVSEIKFYTKNPNLTDEILLKTNVDYDDDIFYLTAYKSGNEIWSKVIPFKDDYDLVGVQYITTANDKVFVINEYKLEALDITTGETVWRDSSDIGIAAVGSCFDAENEILYLTGWDGPADVLAYDMEGNLLFTDDVDVDAYWPYMMTLNEKNSTLNICFDSDSSIVSYNLNKQLLKEAK